ncbi:Tim44 domain-containing protein [Marinospirillum perlucidum]|uniref:Tim44 domain-containing protein n=1 Tax=Marinospirillum perlucidum TaxID=1982602 RepID=UPI00138FCA45|nr:TIM44-like domain-containing protein [Marinospirillum perlucidum]
MTRFLALSLSCLLIFFAWAQEADARRFGGGVSSGLFSRQAKSSPPPTRQETPAVNQAGKSTARNRGLAGPLMGLAAGGLLASLFFGGGFEGMQGLDWILILLLGWFAFSLMRRRRAQSLSPAGASVPGQPFAEKNLFDTAPGSSVQQASYSQSRQEYPPGFDQAGFLSRAKRYFVDLQQAWDNRDFSLIEEFVTPALFRFLQEERSRQPGQTRTRVGKLDAEILLMQPVGNSYEVAVRFTGSISEEGAPEQPFCEIWHLTRDWSQPSAPWLIQGIEQAE